MTIAPPHACKDIPDEQFLTAVDDAIQIRSDDDGRQWVWATRWDVAAVLAGRPDLVGIGEACDPSLFPPDLLSAKIGQLVRRGVLDGCACGCRGDLSRPGGTEPERILRSDSAS
ncbi:hypothetical protein Drose_05850 [Dactylosporangium roseum]|uniref:Uncharacterized protein n=1 Tax=Dactylosporangium roseum TaxID=47989 RepID=A0ABY5Z6W8_9ACTN|nr:hypothetical protein [Dactylosporangium roseum]UWZ37794.1 hypothetical protein Drose_05850 [Dactylosporangium roseum]